MISPNLSESRHLDAIWRVFESSGGSKQTVKIQKIFVWVFLQHESYRTSQSYQHQNKSSGDSRSSRPNLKQPCSIISSPNKIEFLSIFT